MKLMSRPRTTSYSLWCASVRLTSSHRVISIRTRRVVALIVAGLLSDGC